MISLQNLIQDSDCMAHRTIIRYRKYIFAVSWFLSKHLLVHWPRHLLLALPSPLLLLCPWPMASGPWSSGSSPLSTLSLSSQVSPWACWDLQTPALNSHQRDQFPPLRLPLALLRSSFPAWGTHSRLLQAKYLPRSCWFTSSKSLPHLNFCSQRTASSEKLWMQKVATKASTEDSLQGQP